jgi:hypothetical protein
MSLNLEWGAVTGVTQAHTVAIGSFCSALFAGSRLPRRGRAWDRAASAAAAASK